MTRRSKLFNPDANTFSRSNFIRLAKRPIACVSFVGIGRETVERSQ
jgi:hypothetical protein